MESIPFTVVYSLTKEEFIDTLTKYGTCIDFSDSHDRSIVKNPIFLGSVLDVYKANRQNKKKNQHEMKETLVTLIRSLINVGQEKEPFRVVFLGNVVRSLLKAEIKEGDIIALLKPKYFTTCNVPSLDVGPLDVKIWLCKNKKRGNNPDQLKSEEMSRSGHCNNKREAINEFILSDNTEEDPNYIPNTTKVGRRQSKINFPGNENTEDDGMSVTDTTISSVSFSIKRDHQVYRSRPVILNERDSREKAGLSRRAEDQTLNEHNINNKGPRIEKSNPQKEKSNNSQIKNFKKQPENISRMNNTYNNRCEQERANNILSQNTAVAGSIEQSSINASNNHFIAPDTSKHFDRTHILNRAPDCCDTGCTKHFESRCQNKPCCIRNRNQNDCHRCYHHCNTCYHMESCRISCHCLLHGSCNSHCCSLGNYPYSNVCRCVRDNSCRTDSNCLCGNHLERVCNCSHLNPRSHYTSACRSPEKSCCRHSIYNPHVHTGCDCRHSYTAQYKSHVNKPCHDHRCNENALKSLEQLIERRSHYMDDRDQLGCLAAGSIAESAERTERWVEACTPSIPSPPGSSVSRARSPPRHTSSILQSRVSHSSSMPRDSPSSNKSSNHLGCVSEKQFSQKEDNSEKITRSVFYENIVRPFDPSNPESSCLEAGPSYKVNNMNSQPLKATSTKNQNIEIENCKQYEKSDFAAQVNSIDINKCFNNQESETSKSTENNIYQDRTLVSDINVQAEKDLTQNQKSSDETFPELRLDTSPDGIDNEKVSSDNPSSDNASVPLNQQEQEIQLSESVQNKASIDDNITNTGEEAATSNRYTSSSTTNEKSGLIVQKTFSLSVFNKINTITRNDKIEGCDQLNKVPETENDGTADQNAIQKSTECDEQMELICESKFRKRKRKKKKQLHGKPAQVLNSGCVSPESVKSNETIDVESGPETTESSTCTFFDAQSNPSGSQKSSAEKWLVKPLHEIIGNQKTTEELLKMLPGTSMKKSYDFKLFHGFEATGVIINIVPNVLDCPSSLVQGFCVEKCLKSYTYDEFNGMEDLDITCTSCRYSKHLACPGCIKQGLSNPLCFFFSFEIHLLEGDKVLRIEVEGQEGVEFLGCTPTTYLTGCSKLANKLKKIIVSSPPFNWNSVVQLKANLKTKCKSGTVILTLRDTSLKKNLFAMDGHYKF